MSKLSDCNCPISDGKIYHSRETCTDPVVARLDWYAFDEEPPGGVS